jgi:hypothetical protein
MTEDVYKNVAEKLKVNHKTDVKHSQDHRKL